MIEAPNGRRLIQDDDGHWYLIPADHYDDFEVWLKYQEVGVQLECPTIDFGFFRLDGGPENLTIFTFTYLLN